MMMTLQDLLDELAELPTSACTAIITCNDVDILSVHYQGGQVTISADISEDRYDVGKDEGYKEGYDEGYDTGKDEGYDDGYEVGKDEGYKEGLEEGKARD